MIRRPKLSEIDMLVKLHIENLKSGISHFLGEYGLRLIYKYFISDKNSSIFVYEENNEIMGLVSSTNNAPEFFSKFKKINAVNLGFSLLSKSLKSPLLTLKLVFPNKYHWVHKAELLLLFVNKKYRGKNIGTKLVKKIIEEFKKNDVKNFQITILSENVAGKRFYEKLGFIKVGKFTYIDEKRDIYEYKIGN
jgi:ribosomal protein S18 acetylase RimI-like enzyme